MLRMGVHPKVVQELLAACRRERRGSYASRSASACVVHGTGTRARTACSCRQNRSALVTQRPGKMPPCPRYAQDKVGKRLRLKAKQTRHHSPAAAEIPRKENWRKPSISLMMPITGSTVHLRAP